MEKIENQQLSTMQIRFTNLHECIVRCCDFVQTILYEADLRTSSFAD